MDTLPIPLIFIAVASLIAFGFYFGLQAEKKRNEAVAKYAEDLGLQYTQQLDANDNNRFQFFKLSQKGRGRKSKNAIVADSGELRMVIFDYQYTTGSGKNSNTARQTVVLVQTQSLSCPEFSLSPESFLHRIGDMFGFKDIDFDDDKAFSNRFLLHGESEDAVRAFFTPERRKAFLQYEHITVEGNHNCFIFFQPAKRWKPEELKGLMEKAFSLYQALASEN